VVLVTAPELESGISLARDVVERGLAACGNVVPGLTSIYRWKGKVEEDREVLIIFKTNEDTLAELKERVLELHPYQVPEFLAVEVADGHLPYLEWIGEVVGRMGRP
jgi:periplasmic divalent cation tolerance protein